MKTSQVILFTIIVSIISYAQKVSSPEDFLRALYTTVHLPSEDRQVPHRIDFSNRNSLAKYFDTKLVKLFIKDAKYKIKTHAIGCLDFDPIYDAQDMDSVTKDITISKVAGRGNVFSVTFTNLDRRTLIYKLTNTSHGWRISNIEYSSHSSLVELLNCTHE
jgi:hypothetical protein